MNKYYLISIPVTFLVIFHLGYIFHDLLMGSWLHKKEAAVTRDEYIIPAIALAFFLYAGIQTYLFPIFRYYSKHVYGWGTIKTAIFFGALIGFLWDALQGGIIEYATFNIPLEVVFVDSGFHVIEGVYTTCIISFFYHRYGTSTSVVKPNE